MAKERTSLYYLKFAENFKTYATGDIIFREGDPGLMMYVVKEGRIELRSGGLLLETVEPGHIFGEMALIEHSVRSATAVAASDCKVVPLDQDKFMFMVQQTPYFAIEVLKIMARRLRTANHELVRTSGTHVLEKPPSALDGL